jgi:hypothetical protein
MPSQDIQIPSAIDDPSNPLADINRQKPIPFSSKKKRRKPNSMNQSSSNVNDRLLLIIYTLSYTHAY